MLEDSDLDLSQEDSPPPRRSGNRSFLVVAGILGGIMLVALIGLAVYALVILPGLRAAEAPTLSAAQITNTAVARGLQITNTPTQTRTPTRTATPTATATTAAPPTATDTVAAPIFTDTGAPTTDPATQTVAGLLTQAALAQTQAAATSGPTSTPSSDTPTVTPSALPQSGFGDSSGAPLLLAAAALLLIVIIAARRLRNTA